MWRMFQATTALCSTESQLKVCIWSPNSRPRSTPSLLELGKTIGRQNAHDVVYQAAQAAASQNLSFPDRLAADQRVTAHLSQSVIDALLDPASHTGLSASIAHQQVEVARRFAREIHAHLQS
jgi:hypothetical protein